MIARAQRGDSGALAQLLQMNYSFLLKYLLKITMHQATAEDLTQETMLKCIEKIRLYNGQSKFSSWLMTIATNKYVDLMRRKKQERSWQEQEQSLRSLRWQFTSRNEEWPDVLDAIARLPYDVRIPILLKHYYGFSYDEIAAMIDIPAGTVKSRVFNGIQQIRKELETSE